MSENSFHHKPVRGEQRGTGAKLEKKLAFSYAKETRFPVDAGHPKSILFYQRKQQRGCLVSNVHLIKE